MKHVLVIGMIGVAAVSSYALWSSQTARQESRVARADSRVAVQQVGEQGKLIEEVAQRQTREGSAMVTTIDKMANKVVSVEAEMGNHKQQLAASLSQQRRDLVTRINRDHRETHKRLAALQAQLAVAPRPAAPSARASTDENWVMHRSPHSPRVEGGPR